MNSLPPTGSTPLLETLSPHLDDEFINDLFRRRRRQGRHSFFGPAQLFRVLLLGLLTPAHSFNLLVELLGENRSWRKFAFLPNKHRLPDAKMLHEFRDRLDLIKLRAINRHLLMPFLENWDGKRKSVGIIDSTDLPAATHSFKKKQRPLFGGSRGHWCPHRQKRTKPLVYRIQETHVAALAAATNGCGIIDPTDVVGGARQPRGRVVFGAFLELLLEAFGFRS